MKNATSTMAAFTIIVWFKMLSIYYLAQLIKKWSSTLFGAEYHAIVFTKKAYQNLLGKR